MHSLPVPALLSGSDPSTKAPTPTLARPRVAALPAHLLHVSQISRKHRRLTARFATAIQDYTARAEHRSVLGDPADPNLKVSLPAGIAHHLGTAQHRGELGTQRDPADLAFRN
jgi:hypothetical protein